MTAILPPVPSNLRPRRLRRVEIDMDVVAVRVPDIHLDNAEILDVIEPVACALGVECGEQTL